MAALPDWLKKNIPKASLGAAIGAAAFAPDIAGVVTSEHKLTALSKALANIYFWVGKIFGPLRQALVGGWMILGFNAIGKAVQSLVKDTGSLEAALRRLQSIRGFERQFTALTGGLSAAKQRVAELLALSQRGPFKFEDIAEASKNLEVLTRGAMSGANATRTIGNVAIASGNGINDVATAVGQFYSTLRAGQPIEGATDQLRQMGVISNFTADQLKSMAENGAPATVIFSTLTESLDKTHSSLRGAADDLGTVSAEHEKAAEEMKVRFGAPWTQAEIQSTKNMTAAMVAITPALESVSKSFATVYTGFSTTSSWLAKLISQSPMVQSAIESIGKAFSYLAVAMAAAGAVLSVVAFPALMAQATSLATTVTSFLVPALLRLGISFTAIAQGSIILAGTLRVLAALLVGGAFAGGVIALAGVVVNLGISIKKMVDAHQEMRRAFNQGNDALLRQISGARTLAQAHEALAKALQQSASAEKNLRDLQNDPNAAKKLDYWFKLNEAYREVAKSKDAVQKAMAIEGVITPEAQELASAKAQQKRHQEEIDFQRSQSRGGPEARIAGARERAGVLGARAERGTRGQELRAQLAQDLIQNRADTITAEEDKRKAQAKLDEFRALPPSEKRRRPFMGEEADKEIKAADEQLKGLRKESNRIREQAKYAETPEGKGAAIEKLQRRLQLGQNLKEEQRAGLRADIARLQVEQETLLLERESAEANKERSDELKTQAELADRNLRLEKISAQAQLETARATGSPGERARKEFEISQRRIKAEQAEVTRLPATEQNKERLKQLQAELSETRRGERERIRGQTVTRFQTRLETAGTRAQLTGRGEEAKTAEHVGSFVSKFEQLRQEFGDAEAKQIALQQEQNEIAKEGASVVGQLKPIADSLTRIGGGGGVGGPTGDPQLLVQQRQATLQEAANRYLDAIEKELRNQGAPPEEEAGAGAKAGAIEEIKPETLEALGIQPGQPEQNIDWGFVKQFQDNIERQKALQEKEAAAAGTAPALTAPAAPAIAPPAPPAVAAPPPTIAPPAAPASTPAPPAVAPPAAPVAAVAAPAVAPPAAPASVPASLVVPITQQIQPPPIAPAAQAVQPAAAIPPEESAPPAMPTIAQPGYHLPPSYAENIGKTIGTKEYPLPSKTYEKQIGTTIGTKERPLPPLKEGGSKSSTKAMIIPGMEPMHPIPTPGGGRDGSQETSATLIGILNNIYKQNKQSNEHLGIVADTSKGLNRTF